MKKTYPKLFILVSLIALSGCSSNSPDDLVRDIPENVSYDNDVRPIIESNCIACHQEPPINGAPMPLIDYAKVKQAVQERGLIDRISRDQGAIGMMPNGGTRLPENSINIITKWRDQGFQE
jgi:hypothetical protein